MRRKDREITDLSTIISIIDECEIFRIGLADGDFPYIVPLNFGYKYENNNIAFYIHGAKIGKKYEMLINNPYCSFEMDIPLKLDCNKTTKNATMRYKSIIGKCKVELLNEDVKHLVMKDVIMARYKETKNFDYDEKFVNNAAVFKLTVIELSCKVNPIKK